MSTSIIKQDTVNRNGKCPNCKRNWKGADIYEHLRKLNIYGGKTNEEIMGIARNNFGWTKENPTNFSEVVVHNIEGVTLLECPNIMCKHVYTEDGTEYSSLWKYYHKDDVVGEIEGDMQKNIFIGKEEPYPSDKPYKPIKFHATKENRFEIEAEIQKAKEDGRIEDAPF